MFFTELLPKCNTVLQSMHLNTASSDSVNHGIISKCVSSNGHLKAGAALILESFWYACNSCIVIMC